MLPAPLLNLRRCDPEPPWLPFRGGPRVPKGPWGLVPLVAQVAQAGLRPCAFVPSCQLEGLFGGPLPFSHWAPYLGQSQRYCWGRSVLVVSVETVPRGSHAGENEVGQKCRAALWREDRAICKRPLRVQEDGHPRPRPSCMCLNARQMEPYPYVPSLAQPPPDDDVSLPVVVGGDRNRPGGCKATS